MVMVSAADIEDLPEVDGFVEFANFPPDGGTGRAGPAGRFVPRAGALAAWRAPALLEGKGDQGAETATPAKTDTTGKSKTVLCSGASRCQPCLCRPCWCTARRDRQTSPHQP